MTDDPTPMGVPISIVVCPHCQQSISVALRAHPPIALPAGPGQPPAAPPTCCLCPHCRHMVYPALRAVPELAPPARDESTALVPNLPTTKRMP